MLFKIHLVFTVFVFFLTLVTSFVFHNVKLVITMIVKKEMIEEDSGKIFK